MHSSLVHLARTHASIHNASPNSTHVPITKSTSQDDVYEETRNALLRLLEEISRGTCDIRDLCVFLHETCGASLWDRGTIPALTLEHLERLLDETLEWTAEWRGKLLASASPQQKLSATLLDSAPFQSYFQSQYISSIIIYYKALILFTQCHFFECSKLLVCFFEDTFKEMIRKEDWHEFFGPSEDDSSLLGGESPSSHLSLNKSFQSNESPGASSSTGFFSRSTTTQVVRSTVTTPTSSFMRSARHSLSPQSPSNHHSHGENPFESPFYIEDVDERLSYRIICILFESFLCIPNFEYASLTHSHFLDRYSSLMDQSMPQFYIPPISGDFLSVQEVQLCALNFEARLLMFQERWDLAYEKITSRSFYKITDERVVHNGAEMVNPLICTEAFIQFKFVETLLEAHRGKLSRALERLELVRGLVHEAVYLHHVGCLFRVSGERFEMDERQDLTVQQKVSARQEMGAQLILHAYTHLVGSSSKTLSAHLQYQQYQQYQIELEMALNLMHHGEYTRAMHILSVSAPHFYHRPVLWILLAESVLENYTRLRRGILQSQSSTKIQITPQDQILNLKLPTDFIPPVKLDQEARESLTVAQSFLRNAHILLTKSDEKHQIPAILLKLAFVHFQQGAHDIALEYANSVLEMSSSQVDGRTYFLAVLYCIASLVRLGRGGEELQRRMEELKVMKRVFHASENVHDGSAKNGDSQEGSVDLSSLRQDEKDHLLLVLVVNELLRGDFISAIRHQQALSARYESSDEIYIAGVPEDEEAIREKQRKRDMLLWIHVLRIFTLVLQGRDSSAYASQNRLFPAIHEVVQV